MKQSQITPTRMVHLRMVKAQLDELDTLAGVYGKTRTALITEAITYWLNTQKALYGDKINALMKEAV